MQQLPLRGPSITLVQALKVSGLASTGGQAKILVREGLVLVNGQAASQPSKQLRAGDRFRVKDGEEWLVTE